MKIKLVIALTMLGIAASSFASVGFSAADVPSAGLRKQGKVVIRNDERSITAFRFFGNIKEALVSLKSIRVVATRSFGVDLRLESASQFERSRSSLGDFR